MEAPPVATGILDHPIVPDTEGAIPDGIDAFLPEVNAAQHDEGRRSPASIDQKLSDEKHHEFGSTPTESFTGKEEHGDKLSVDDFTAEEDAELKYYKGEPIIRTGMYLLPVRPEFSSVSTDRTDHWLGFTQVLMFRGICRCVTMRTLH